ncbi:MAG: ATP-dependent metallopeptidase FtsH/Yme1/Tma family protein, partial [Acidimicrobiia bacterium]
MPPETRPPSAPDRPTPDRPGAPRPIARWPRWGMWAAIGILFSLLVVSPLFQDDGGSHLTYSQFLERVRADEVESVKIDNQSNKISGVTEGGTEFTVDGPKEIPDADLALFKEHSVAFDFKTPTPNVFLSWLPVLLPVALIIGFFVWMNRRAQGQ